MTNTKTAPKTSINSITQILEGKSRANSTDFSDFVSNATKGISIKKEKKMPQIYTLKKAGSIAIRLMAAFNALNKWLENIEKYSRAKILEDILPEFATRLSNGENVESMHVVTKETKCLVVPTRKYAKITQENIQNLKTLGLNINSNTSYILTDAVSNLINQHPKFLNELVQSVINSKVLDENTKNGFKNGLLTFAEEEHSYNYANDPLDSIGMLAKNNAKKALDILEAVKPTYMFRSFEIENKNLEMSNAIDIIKNNINAPALL